LTPHALEDVFAGYLAGAVDGRHVGVEEPGVGLAAAAGAHGTDRDMAAALRHVVDLVPLD
jgi:hypothetical protein